MREISGVLTMLGSATVISNAIGKSFVRFDTIEIGGQVWQKMTTARSLEDFISRGLGQQVTLYRAGNLIVGVKLADGKVYYWSRSKATVIFVAIMALAGAAMLMGAISAGTLALGMVAAYWGILYAIFKSELKHILSIQPGLAAMGGVALRS